MGRPSLIRGRNKMEYYPGMIGLPDAASPPMLNKSWTITAELTLASDKESGMIITHGGLEGGYGLYLRDGKPTFVYNFLDLERNFGLLNSGISWHPRWSGRFVLLLWAIAYMTFFGAFYLGKPSEAARGLAAVLRNRPRTRFERFFAFLLWQPLRERRSLGGAAGSLSSSTAPAPETSA